MLVALSDIDLLYFIHMKYYRYNCKSMTMHRHHSNTVYTFICMKDLCVCVLCFIFLTYIQVTIRVKVFKYHISTFFKTFSKRYIPYVTLKISSEWPRGSTSHTHTHCPQCESAFIYHWNSTAPYANLLRYLPFKCVRS